MAAFLLAFTAYFAFYLHEARMYSLLALVSAWLAWSYARIVHTQGGATWLSLANLCLSAAAVVYVHAFGFVLLAATGIYHLVFIPKDRKWLKVCIAMIGAGCLYLPWLPIALRMLDIRTSYASDSLAWHETLLALASIYSNGLSILVPLCIGLLILFRKRLSASQRYVGMLAAFIVLVALAVNEVAPIVVARRIRYSIILAPLWCSALAIAITLLPSWKRIRWPAIVVWLAAFAVYDGSPELYLYTNSLDQNRRQIPHFQSLVYKANLPISKSDFILSFHPDTELGRKTLDYYGRQLRLWRGLIHIHLDDTGRPALQSTDTRYLDLSSIAIWNFPLWVLHNPQETNMQSMGDFAVDFSRQFHSCGRYLETDTSIVDLYVKTAVPCSLVTSPQPLRIIYDNGTELANIVIQSRSGELNAYFWWTNTMANQYAFSLQLFDIQSQMAAQLDDVVGGDALVHKSLDTADLLAGEYSAKLILYDFESGVSQPGVLVADNRSFEREVTIANIHVSA